MLVACRDASQYWKASIVCDPSRVVDRLQRTPTYSGTSTNYLLLLSLATSTFPTSLATSTFPNSLATSRHPLFLLWAGRSPPLDSRERERERERERLVEREEEGKRRGGGGEEEARSRTKMKEEDWEGGARSR